MNQKLATTNQHPELLEESNPQNPNNIQTLQNLSFPKPTGNYTVGTTSYEFIDRQREEIYTEDPNDKREITAKVWYPSEKVPGAATAPYMSEDLSRAVASELGLPSEEFVNATQSIQTNSIANAPVAEAEAEYPVLFFSHGGADVPELHSIKAEELASQGYVVVAINHTYDSTANVFSDGRVVSQSSIFDIATRDQETPAEIDARSTNITAQDAQFVLDELEKFNAGNDPKGLFDGKLDLERVGIFGFSLGGATSAKTLAEDSRFKAGINIDGGLFGDSGQGSLSQPFMFINAESFGTVNSSNPTDKEFAQVQQSFVNNLQNEGYEVDIEGTKHLDLTDMSFFLPLVENSGIDISDIEPILYPDLAENEENFQPLEPQLATQITKDYITAFFDRHLNNQKTPLLNEFDSPYPEVTFQSYLEGEKINPDSNPPQPEFGTVNADVLEIDSTNQLIFAGDGNDLIDATASIGNNRIYSGDGDDTAILGTGDRIIAGAGADRLFAGDGGNNTLAGGEGADQFWIAAGQTPISANIVTDYNPIEDVIGIAGLGIGFGDLSLIQQGDNVLIQTADSNLATFQGITTDSLSEDNFVFA